MKNLYLLFSHKLTEGQLIGAKKELNCNQIIYLPEDLQELWSNVPADKYDEKSLEKIKEFIKNISTEGDYILIQGEWGYTYEMIKYSKKLNLIPIYSTTERTSKEILNNDGTITKTSVFKHIMYKKY